MNDSWGLFDADMETSRLLRISQEAEALGAGRRYINTAAAALVLSGASVAGVGFFSLAFFFCIKRISVQFTVLTTSLLLTDLMQLLSTPVVAIQLLGSSCQAQYCERLVVLWLASSQAGMILHLLVAMEFILISRSNKGTKTVPLFLSVPLVLTLNLMCVLFADVVGAAVGFGTIALALILIVCRLRCRSAFTIKSLTPVLFIAVLSYTATFCPGFVMETMILNEDTVSGHLYDILRSLNNLRLVTDVLLFFAVWRKTPGETPPEVEIAHVSSDFVIQNQHFH